MYRSHDVKDPHFGLITKSIHVKDGAWIASDVFVYPGVTIHELGVAAARVRYLKIYHSMKFMLVFLLNL